MQELFDLIGFVEDNAPGLLAFVLFGSRLRGKKGDWDFLILTENPLSENLKRHIRLYFNKKLPSDLVFSTGDFFDSKNILLLTLASSFKVLIDNCEFKSKLRMCIESAPKIEYSDKYGSRKVISIAKRLL